MYLSKHEHRVNTKNQTGIRNETESYAIAFHEKHPRRSNELQTYRCMHKAHCKHKVNGTVKLRPHFTYLFKLYLL